jgi:hypothetical protein
MRSDTLAYYPFITVRLACTRCARKGSYRLARLAEQHGADIQMTDLLGYLAGDCRWRNPRHPGHGECGAYFADVAGSAPLVPDLIPDVRASLRVVTGGKA